MTENEVIKYLEFHKKGLHDTGYNAECVNFAIKALEEIQQCRAIGAIEEFKALKEKSVAKKPIAHDDCENYLIRCTCGKCTDTRFFHGFCTWCGQALET